MSVVDIAADLAKPRSSGVWDYLSPSRLSLWCRCPLAFKLRYLDGIRTPTTPSLFLGQRVHDALEYFYRHRQLGIALAAADVTERVISSWEGATTAERISFSSESEATRLRDLAVRLVTAYLHQLSEDEPPLAVETRLQAPLVDPLTGEDLGIPLLGIVDLVLGGERAPVICDFKTAASARAPPEITHELQLSCYAFLFRKLSGKAEQGLEIRSLIKTKTPQIVRHEFGPRRQHHFRRLFAVIREYLDALDSGRFNYRPGWSCSFCEFRDRHCAKWGGT